MNLLHWRIPAQCGLGQPTVLRNPICAQTYNARNAVEYHFFVGIVYVWWLLKPSTSPIPHKSTDSNLMRGLGSVVWLTYHHTELIPKRFDTTPKAEKLFMAHLYMQ